MKNFYMFTVLPILMCSSAFAATYTYYTKAPFDAIYTDNACKSVAHNISNSYRSGGIDIITNGAINADNLKEAVRKLSNGETTLQADKFGGGCQLGPDVQDTLSYSVVHGRKICYRICNSTKMDGNNCVCAEWGAGASECIIECDAGFEEKSGVCVDDSLGCNVVGTRQRYNISHGTKTCIKVCDVFNDDCSCASYKDTDCTVACNAGYVPSGTQDACVKELSQCDPIQGQYDIGFEQCADITYTKSEDGTLIGRGSDMDRCPRNDGTDCDDSLAPLARLKEITKMNTWATKFDYGTIYGVSACKPIRGKTEWVDESIGVNYYGHNQHGKAGDIIDYGKKYQDELVLYCWCKMTSPQISDWVYSGYSVPHNNADFFECTDPTKVCEQINDVYCTLSCPERCAHLAQGDNGYKIEDVQRFRTSLFTTHGSLVDNETEKVCESGQYLDGDWCKKCPSGYTSAAGSKSIYQCYKSCEAKCLNDDKCPKNATCVGKKSGKEYYGNYGCVVEDTVTCTLNDADITCHPGYEKDEDGDCLLPSTIQIEECPAGEYYDVKKEECAKCPWGTFAATAGKRTRCELCKPGTMKRTSDGTYTACDGLCYRGVVAEWAPVEWDETTNKPKTNPCRIARCVPGYLYNATDDICGSSCPNTLGYEESWDPNIYCTITACKTGYHIDYTKRFGMMGYCMPDQPDQE